MACPHRRRTLTLPQGRNLSSFENGAACRKTDLLKENIGGCREKNAELVGVELGATGAIDLQTEEPRGERVWDMSFRPKRYKKKLIDLGYAFQGHREFHGGVVVGLYVRKRPDAPDASDE